MGFLDKANDLQKPLNQEQLKKKTPSIPPARPFMGPKEWPAKK